MNRSFTQTLFTLSLIAATSVTHADTNFYAGAGVGHATSDACETSGIYCDDSSSAWKALVGYNFHENLGVEFSYNNIGKAYSSDVATDYSASIDSDAFALSLVGRIELVEEFSVFAKVGATSWTSDAKIRVANTRTDFEDDGSDMTYGVGATWTFDKDYHLSLEWQRYEIEFDDFSGALGEEGDSDVVSLLYTVSF